MRGISGSLIVVVYFIFWTILYWFVSGIHIKLDKKIRYKISNSILLFFAFVSMGLHIDEIDKDAYSAYSEELYKTFYSKNITIAPYQVGQNVQMQLVYS